MAFWISFAGRVSLFRRFFILLILFSVTSWAIIAQKFRQIRRAKRESEKFIEIFWDRRNLSSIHDASRELDLESGRTGLSLRI